MFTCVSLQITTEGKKMYIKVHCMWDCSAAAHARKGPIVTCANMYMREGDVSLITTVSDLL